MADATRWLARARYVRSLARLGRQLPDYLRHPTSAAEAGEWVRDGLAARERRFLHLIQRAVFDNHSSPYLPLLRLAGCERGDVARLLAQEGLEGTLARLRDTGVYLTFDEFKGRREVERGGQRFRFRERDFDSPSAGAALTTTSGGTRGPATRIRTSLPYLSDLARTTALALDAHGLDAPEHAVWLVSGLTLVLLTAKLGRPPLAWFHPLAPLSRGARVTAFYVSAVGRMTGFPLPRPEHLPLERPEAMARWLPAAPGGAGRSASRPTRAPRCGSRGARARRASTSRA